LCSPFLWGATEWVTWRLAFRPQRGHPWFNILGWPVYDPPVFFLTDPRRPIETTLRAMMTTPHAGKAGVHHVVASSVGELINKSDNERSGVLSSNGIIELSSGWCGRCWG
jgi:type IV secretory pathway TraG/TraD family ATPase VirD4